MNVFLGFLKYLALLFITILLIIFYYLINGYDTLVVEKDINSKNYVIDGWMIDRDIVDGFQIAREREFKQIYSLGLINGYNSRYNSDNHADFAKDRILHKYRDIDKSKIEIVKFKANIDRTYKGVVALKKRLQRDKVDNITLLTIDVHTAKSLYIYEQVFKSSGIDVGVLKIDTINRDNWYKNSEDFVKVTSELIALLIAKIRY